MSTPIPLEEAWARMFALVTPLDSENLASGDAAGRYLAADLIARRRQPDADLSAMDGFAVAGDGPGWRIVGEARAGAGFAGTLGDGEAVWISTGAACPPGTSAIVPIEDASVDSDILSASAPPPGAHIRRCGFDFAQGAHLLATGTRMAAAQIALALASGHATLTVARRPRVAVIELGDELVADPANCPPGRLPASNGAMVAAMSAGVGAQTDLFGPLPDRRDAIARAMAEAADHDVVVTTAGASVGVHDHVRGALADAGADLALWRVAIRPGKPLIVAQRGRQIILGLPGNPVSAHVTAYLFLLPLLRALQRATSALPTPLPIPLAAALPKGGDRREFRRARLENGHAVPLGERDSSALLSLAQASLLIDRPAHADPAPAGAVVPCYWLENGGIA